MVRLMAMRQSDWARVFGIACMGVGIGLSVRAYPGADWDALILMLGALMLLRGAVEGPSPSRVAGLVRALRVILFMFAFAAVNRAQGGAGGAVAGALGNWILWAVAALLVALPVLRRGLPWGEGRKGLHGVALIIGTGIAFALVFRWLDPAAADLRTLVALAAVVNAVPILWGNARAVVAGMAFAAMVICVVIAPGAAIWPVAMVVAPVAAGFALLRKKAKGGN